jgi:hypothetical protein
MRVEKHDEERSFAEPRRVDDLLEQARKITNSQKLSQQVSANAAYAAAFLPFVLSDFVLSSDTGIPVTVARLYCRC